VVDEQHDLGAGVAAADSEVPEPGVIAKGDVAAGVEAVRATADEKQAWREPSVLTPISPSRDYRGAHRQHWPLRSRSRLRPGHH
jgi:hypothetical protein